ncbi:MAG: hypothetical protein ACRDQZ_02780, partial [Mycobacteriales bacterium]
MGRTSHSKLTSDPQGTVSIDTTYDLFGRVASVSNPHRDSASSTDGTTTYAYDPLGRVTLVIEPDDTPSAPQRVQTSYTGNCATATDETLRSRKSCSDALGRLTNVWEDPGGLSLETDYTYNALNNLTCVQQKGTASGTGCDAEPSNDATSPWRIRRFTYDSLSHLLTAANPESGTITYTYDNDGNLLTKTDARGVTANYSPLESPIDAIHRVTKITYTDGTPARRFLYDTQYVYYQTNPIGKLTRSCWNTGYNDCDYCGWDVMGRLARKDRDYLTEQVHYNLAGAPTWIDDNVYAAKDRQVGYTYNAAGRVT